MELGISAEPIPIAPATMARPSVLDERFQSYNIEMVEVTGGRFWKPTEANARLARRRTSLRASAAEHRPASIRICSSIARQSIFPTPGCESWRPRSARHICG